MKKIIYHGSSEIIKRPEYGKGKLYNDYGQGFYCTEHVELAKEWSCTEGADGFVNQYELELEGLKILTLSNEEYSILHWLSLLVHYRGVRLSSPIMKKGAEWLLAYYLIDLNEFDVVIGYRADDSYFSFARAFLRNEISLKQLNYAMSLGKLGEQIVLKSPQAFSQLRFMTYQVTANREYYPKRKRRDLEAKIAYEKELEKEDTDGIYLRDIIREEMLSDDIRLR